MTGSEKDTSGAQHQQQGSSCLTPIGMRKDLTPKEIQARGESRYGIEGWKKFRTEWTDACNALRGGK